MPDCFVIIAPLQELVVEHAEIERVVLKRDFTRLRVEYQTPVPGEL
jgi:hypothetical protein